mmetsp:Transcript_32830/g.57362  ORF Transcript_32830/g.57362 Transcript_32830/m.57362 type:complete len:461 (+) Transcript_32830:2197-3579(+)
MESLDSCVAPLSDSLFIPLDQVKLVICFFSAIPLGWIQWGLVRGRTLRLLYSLVSGIALGLFMFGFEGLQNFFFSSVVVYLMLKFLPRHKVALPVFVFSFSFLSYVHISRMYFDYMGWSMDASSIQMLATVKFISLAFCYQDGLTLRTSTKKSTPEQRQCLVEKLPSVFEYYSFVCFFPAFLIGPAFEYADYTRFIERKGVYKSIPCPFRETLVRLGQALLMMIPLLFVEGKFSHLYVLTDEYYNQPFLYKAVFVQAYFWLVKVRYYVAWKLSEAGCVATGFSFNGAIDGKNNWNRTLGCEVLKIEFSWTIKTAIEGWNVSVSDWLRRYSYERILLSSDKPSATLRSIAQHGTFILSAFWHGFYPAYYVFFFNFSILSECSKMIYIRDFTHYPGYKFLRIVAWVCQAFVSHHLGFTFILLGLNEAYLGYKSMSFIPIGGMFLVWGVLKLGLVGRRKTKQE